MKKLKRIGSSDADENVRQCVANIRLSGLDPSPLAIKLTRAVAEGEVTIDAALEAIREKYRR